MTDASQNRGAKETPEQALEGTAYRFVRMLARGGMGAVVEVVHIELDKPMVVKLLLPDFVARPDLVHRLIQEARVMTRLVHPNIAVVTDLGRTPRSGIPYLVMERLYGAALNDVLKERGEVPVLEALDYVGQTLAGLAAAHQAGIIHRDVKLQNLFLCAPDAQGRRIVKVLDFGIAKNLARELGGKFATAEGTILGTPEFLSPEQARAGKVDARTDVYGAGVVLFRLLCGRAPFLYEGTVHDEESRQQKLLYLLKAHASEVPQPPSHYARQPIHPAVDALVLRALSKRPEDRPEDAAAFAIELEAVARALTDSGSGRAMGPVVAASPSADALPAPSDDHDTTTVQVPVVKTPDVAPAAQADLLSPQPAAPPAAPDISQARTARGTFFMNRGVPTTSSSERAPKGELHYERTIELDAKPADVSHPAVVRAPEPPAGPSRLLVYLAIVVLTGLAVLGLLMFALRYLR